MKIRIVTEKPGWILHRMALELQKRLRNVRINRNWRDADIHYFINYGYCRQMPPSGITVANFTHYDPEHLADDFQRVARQVDHRIAISEKTAEVLRGIGVPDDKITVIIIGADSIFRPKLTLGLVGRTYPGGRKGEHLVAALLEDEQIMDGLQIVAANKGWGVPVWRFDAMPDFYRAIDYLLVPALIEGGPVPFMEALACGTPSIAPPIGVVPQFTHVEYATGDVESLKSAVRKVKEDYVARLGPLASQMEPYDWDRWAEQHRILFERLIAQRHS